MSKWISVEDRLPEEYQVLVYDSRSERIGIREYYCKMFNSIDSDGDDGMCSTEITHWMPLPEPPVTV